MPTRSTTISIPTAEAITSLILQGKNVKEHIQTLFSNYSEYLPQAFNEIRLHTHPSKSSIGNLTSIAQALLEISRQKNLSPEKTTFITNLISLVSPFQFLVEHEEEIMLYVSSADNIPKFEKQFSRGLIQYRLGNYLAAEREFQKIDPCANIRPHQSGARSYLFRWPGNDYFAENHQPFQVLRKAQNKAEGIVLISCDYTYFQFYFAPTFEKLLGLGASLHVHVVLPHGVSPYELMRMYPQDKLGISYEEETAESARNKNRKTYYAVVRYLICRQILNLYGQSVLISDIDIDFHRPIVDVFKSIKDDEIALYFGKLDMPWVKIMAGFNLFGKDTGNSEFLIYLQNYIRHCLSSGRDGWMMDQVALDAAYQNASPSQKARIKSIVKLTGFSPKQYSNRQAARVHATKRLQNLAIAS